jgi:hypothetical protein
MERKIKYSMIDAEKLRAINPMTDHEIIAAQKNVTADMIEALEQMINLAKSGRLQSESVLALRAAAWKGTAV